MKWILYIISFLWIILGVIQVLYTEKSQKVLKHLMTENNPKLLAVIPLMIGFLLCISAFWSQATWFIFILGLLGCLKGILFLFLPTKHTQKFLQWWFEKASDQLIRLGGLIMVVLGVSIISWI